MHLITIQDGYLMMRMQEQNRVLKYIKKRGAHSSPFLYAYILMASVLCKPYCRQLHDRSL